MERIIDFLKNKVLGSDEYSEYEDFLRGFNGELKEEISEGKHLKKLDDEVMSLCRDSLRVVSNKKKILDNLEDSKRKNLRRVLPKDKFLKILRLCLNLMHNAYNFETGVEGVEHGKIKLLLENDHEYVVKFIHSIKKVSQIPSLRAVELKLFESINKDVKSIYDRLNQYEDEDSIIKDKLLLLNKIVVLEKNKIDYLGKIVSSFASSSIQRIGGDLLRELDNTLKILGQFYTTQEAKLKEIEALEEKKIDLVDKVVQSLRTERGAVKEIGAYKVIIHIPVLDVKPYMENKLDYLLKKEIPLERERKDYKRKTNSLIRERTSNDFVITSIRNLEAKYHLSEEAKRKNIREWAKDKSVLSNTTLKGNDLMHLIAYFAMLNHEANRNAWSRFGEKSVFIYPKHTSFKKNYLVIAYRMNKVRSEKEQAHEMEKAVKEA